MGAIAGGAIGNTIGRGEGNALATAIDQVGADKAQLFLVKLALLNANALADEGLFQQLIEAALLDL